MSGKCETFFLFKAYIYMVGKAEKKIKDLEL